MAEGSEDGTTSNDQVTNMSNILSEIVSGRNRKSNDASSMMPVDPKATISNNNYTVGGDADDYDLADLDYVGTINEIGNVENANAPVHTSRK